MSKVNQMKRDIDEDINSIKDVLNNKNIEEMLKVHKYMDSKYQSKINTWGLSQYGWSDDLGFTYELIGESGISERYIKFIYFSFPLFKLHNIKIFQFNSKETLYKLFIIIITILSGIFHYFIVMHSKVII